MDTMNNMQLMGFGVLALIIWGVALSSIIAGATKSKKLIDHAETQTKLLAEIAKKQGVDTNELRQILSTSMKAEDIARIIK